MPVADHVRLVDHHCHGVMPGNLDGTTFRLLATEADCLSAPGLETLDHQFGLGIRAFCAPELGLPAHVDIDTYLARRTEVGAAEVNRLLIGATNTELLIDETGFLQSPVTTPDELSAATGIPVRTVARLETMAEEVVTGWGGGDFVSAIREELARIAPGVIGFKSIIAYRHGFDIADHAPDLADVRRAADRWLRAVDAGAQVRLTDPVLLQFLLWEAVPFAMPIQLHVGFGDSDIQLFRSDPSRATRFLAATQHSGATFMLLHNYPFLREAAILSQLFPHVYCDAGEISHYAGPGAWRIHRELLEVAPFTKVVYSSDAYGLAEHYYVSARSWRHAMNRIMDEWIADGWTNAAGAERIVEQIARENALRVYLPGVQ
jgi:predicted TIM-barrel fold metal-dependent hydrolase